MLQRLKEEVQKWTPDEKSNSDPNDEDDSSEAIESDHGEGSSEKFIKAMNKPNVFHNFRKGCMRVSGELSTIPVMIMTIVMMETRAAHRRS